MQLPALDELLASSDRDIPRSVALVFGRRGTGKTWARNKFVQAWRTSAKYFIIPIYDTKAIDDAWGHYKKRMSWWRFWRMSPKWDNADLTDLIMQAGVRALVRHVLQVDSSTWKTFRDAKWDENRQALPSLLYLLAIMYDAPQMELTELAGKLDVRDTRLRSFLGRVVDGGKYAALLSDIRITVADNAGGQELFDIAVRYLFPTLSTEHRLRTDTGIGHRSFARVRILEAIAESLGFARTVVVIDALDEVPAFLQGGRNGGFSIPYELLESLMDESFLAKVNVFGFLPLPKAEMPQALLNRARCGKNICLNLEWEYPSLVKMLERNWEVATDKKSSLNDFFNGDLISTDWFPSMGRRCVLLVAFLLVLPQPSAPPLIGHARGASVESLRTAKQSLCALERCYAGARHGTSCWRVTRRLSMRWRLGTVLPSVTLRILLCSRRP